MRAELSEEIPSGRFEFEGIMQKLCQTQRVETET